MKVARAFGMIHEASSDTAAVRAANWRPGDKVIVPPPATTEAAEKRVNNPEFEVTDWYFSRRSL